MTRPTVYVREDAPAQVSVSGDRITVTFAGVSGVGVPVGGDTGQVLGKASGDDFDTAWQDVGAASHPNLAAHDAMGLATDVEMVAFENLRHYAPAGALIESLPRYTPNVTNISTLASGRMNMYLLWLPAGITISSITFRTGNSGGVSLLNQWFALYDADLHLLRQTVDDGNAAWGANTNKTLALTSSYIIPASGLYYVGIMVRGGTPNLTGVQGDGGGITFLAPIVSGFSSTGLTDTAPDPAAAITATVYRAWFYLS